MLYKYLTERNNFNKTFDTSHFHISIGKFKSTFPLFEYVIFFVSNTLWYVNCDNVCNSRNMAGNLQNGGSFTPATVDSFECYVSFRNIIGTFYLTCCLHVLNGSVGDIKCLLRLIFFKWFRIFFCMVLLAPNVGFKMKCCECVCYVSSFT